MNGTTKPKAQGRPERAVALLMVASSAFAAGCEPAAKSPADEAAFMESTRCGPEVNEAALAAVLEGQALQGVGPLYSTIEAPSLNERSDELGAQRVGPVYSAAEANSLGDQARLRGALLTVSALPGVTAEWLDRELECHGARVVLGRVKPLSDDPFWLPGSKVDIDVRPVKDGFVIGVAGFSSTDARQILDRARAFAKAKKTQAPAPAPKPG